jgi:amino acid transporter
MGGVDVAIVFIFFLIYITMAITLVIFPEKIWKITESWRAIRMPSKEYFMLMRIGGVLCALFGIFLLIQFLKHN